MKLQALLLAFPLLAAANPLAAPEAEAVAEPVANPNPAAEAAAALRASAAGPRKCALTGSNVRYRKCPSTNPKKCPGLGEYGAKGTEVYFKCWTTGDPVNGNYYWDRSEKGYVSETLVNTKCAYKLPMC